MGGGKQRQRGGGYLGGVIRWNEGPTRGQSQRTTGEASGHEVVCDRTAALPLFSSTRRACQVRLGCKPCSPDRYIVIVGEKLIV